MALMQPYDASAPRRVFRVGGVTVDELRLELRVDGQPRPVDRKARTILIALLSRPKDVLSKRELLAAAWGNADHAKEGSLNTALFNLRGALGSRGHDIVKSVKDRGYTIGLPVETWTAVDMPRLALGLHPGDEVPSRPQWRLVRPLDPSTRVWLAAHDGTRESWVFLFADTVERSATLHREAAASQNLHERLGEGDERVRVVDCDFDQVPHFIARPFVGVSLSDFAASGGLQPLSLDALIDLAAQVARTVARAHGVGVIHGAVRPGRIMIVKDDDGRLRIRLAGFLGTEDVSADPMLSGGSAVHVGSITEIYTAPEVKAGGPATAASDIYSLGVLLLGLVTRSLGTPVTPASVADVEDPLLQLDIAAATARDPVRRLEAAALAKQLEGVPGRRETTRQQEAYRLQRERYHRIKLALGVLVIALVVAAGLAVEAWHERVIAMGERDRAEQIAAVTEGTVAGLVDDIAHGLGERAAVRLDVLQTLLGRAEATLGRMISLTPGERSLRRLQAKGLTEFGRTFWEQYNLPKALALGTSAAGIQRSLLAGQPKDAGLWIDLSDSQRLIGDTRMRQRDQAGALAAYRNVEDIDQRLEAAEPGDEEGRRRLARAEDLVGDVQMAQGRAQVALATYRAAETLIATAGLGVIHGEGWLVDLAASRKKIGDALDATRDWHGALEIYQKEVVIRRELLSQDPANTGFQHDLALVMNDIGDEEDYLKEWTAARASYSDALTMFQELARADPTNEDWQRNVAVSYADLGDVADNMGDRPGAVAAEDAANRRLNAIAAHVPEDAELQRDIAATEMNLADGLIKNGDLVEALPHAVKSFQMAKRLAAAHPNDPDLAAEVQASLGVAKRAGFKP